MAGHGAIRLQSDGHSVLFSELSATYPLKLLSPRLHHPRVAAVYIMSYGGGLVGGDLIKLDVNVDSDAILLALTQGSTKVFKSRPGSRATNSLLTLPRVSTAATEQTMTVRLQPHATLLLLPDPVTCFSAAAYSQVQRFTLHSTSSLALLDWLNSGRQALGEDWSLARYYSLNEIIVDGARVAKDAMLLEAETDAVEPRNALADRLAPYKCYATLILCGPLLQPLIGRLVAQHQKITVFRCKAPEATIWSLTPIASGIVVRIAGKETEDVKTWLRDSLSSLADVIGLDAYRRAFV